MKSETFKSVTLPKIGYGTWRIGNERSKDSKSLNALRTAIEVGYTHFDTAEMYGSGRAEELIAQAIRESRTSRDELFITSKVMPSHLLYDDVLLACENSLRRLQTDYLDMYLIHWPSGGRKYEETFKALNKLVRDKKVKHLGVSNFNLKLLKMACDLSEAPIITDQVPYSLTDRSYVKNGVLGYCQQNDIFLTAYSPIDEGRLYPDKTLKAIAKAQNTTEFQIALAWVIAQPNIITIPMSANPTHIKENFEAAEIQLSPDEIQQLTNG